MKKLINDTSLKLIFFYSILIFLCRIIPHIPNFSPIFAVIIFSSNFQIKLFKKLIFIIFPLLFSDLFLGFYTINLWVYISYVIIIILNQNFLLSSLKNIFYKTIAYNLIFYILTNFAVWIGSSFYSRDLNGLLECYILALPFLGNSLLSTFIFLLILYKFDKPYLYKNFIRV